MPFEFKLPDLGEGIDEAQVLAWKVKPGQDVAAFDPLCEVESAKAAVELTAPVGGLVVPVVRHADRLSVLEIAREIDRLVTDARERRSTPADLSGSTFTITSF